LGGGESKEKKRGIQRGEGGKEKSGGTCLEKKPLPILGKGGGENCWHGKDPRGVPKQTTSGEKNTHGEEKNIILTGPILAVEERSVSFKENSRTQKKSKIPKKGNTKGS